MKKPLGVSVGTQPLSIIMEEKMKSTEFPTAVISMSGQVKGFEETSISSPMSDILNGNKVVVIGHGESLGSPTGQDLLRSLKKNGQIILTFADEVHQGLPNFWESIR